MKTDAWVIAMSHLSINVAIKAKPHDSYEICPNVNVTIVFQKRRIEMARNWFEKLVPVLIGSELFSANEPNEVGERSPAESEHSETGHRSHGYAASRSPSRTRWPLRKTSSGSSTVKVA